MLCMLNLAEYVVESNAWAIKKGEINYKKEILRL